MRARRGEILIFQDPQSIDETDEDRPRIPADISNLFRRHLRSRIPRN